MSLTLLNLLDQTLTSVLGSHLHEGLVLIFLALLKPHRRGVFLQELQRLPLALLQLQTLEQMWQQACHHHSEFEIRIQPHQSCWPASQFFRLQNALSILQTFCQHSRFFTTLSFRMVQFHVTDHFSAQHLRQTSGTSCEIKVQKPTSSLYTGQPWSGPQTQAFFLQKILIEKKDFLQERYRLRFCQSEEKKIKTLPIPPPRLFTRQKKRTSFLFGPFSLDLSVIETSKTSLLTTEIEIEMNPYLNPPEISMWCPTLWCLVHIISEILSEE